MVRKTEKSIYESTNFSWNGVDNLPSGEPSEPDPTRVGNPYAKFVPKKKADSSGLVELRDKIAAQDQELRQLRKMVKTHEDENRLLVTKLARFRETVSRHEKKDGATLGSGTLRGAPSAKVVEMEMEAEELRDQVRLLSARLTKEQARAEEADQKAAYYYKKWVEANRRNQMYRGPSVARSQSPPANARAARTEVHLSHAEIRGRMQKLEEESERLRDENAKLLAAYRKLQGGGEGGAADGENDRLRRTVRALEEEVGRLRQRDLERDGGGKHGPANPLRWELEEYRFEGTEYLFDRRTGILHVVDPATLGTPKPWPVPVGRLRAGKVLLLDLKDVANSFFAQLDRFLKDRRQRLDDLFNELDTDKSRSLQSHEFKAFVRRVMEEPTEREVQFLEVLLDANGDGHVTYEELIGTVRDLLQVRGEATRMAECIARIGAFVGADVAKAKGIFSELDKDGSGELTFAEVLRALKLFVPDLGSSDRLLLLQLLFLWDVDGNGQTSFDEFCHALKLGEWVKVRSPVQARLDAFEGKGAVTVTATAGGEDPTSLRHRIMALEQECDLWRRKAEALERELLAGRKAEVEADDLRRANRDINKTLQEREAYFQGVEAKYLALDAMLAGFGEPTVDKRIRALAEQNHALIRRLNELDLSVKTLHVNYQRVVAELDAKTKEAAELRERLRLAESSLLSLRAELEAAQAYKERYEAEVRKRIELETAKNNLQMLALEAPALAQEELNRLRLEVVQLKGRLEQARATEEGLRRQLDQVFGGSGLGDGSDSGATGIKNELLLLRRQLQRKEAELEEAQDKLAVYLRSGGGSGGPGGAPSLSVHLLELGSRQNAMDAGKSPEDLRKEIALLREAYARLEDELKRALALLEREQGITRELEAAKTRLQLEVEQLQNELRGRDAQLGAMRDRLGGTSAQPTAATAAGGSPLGGGAGAATASPPAFGLAAEIQGQGTASSHNQGQGAFGQGQMQGPGHAQGQSFGPGQGQAFGQQQGPGVQQMVPATATPARPAIDEAATLGEYQNVLELKAFSAELEPSVVARYSSDPLLDPSALCTFVCVSFYQHPPQLSLVTAGLEPPYDTGFEFLLDVPSKQTYQALVKYMSETSLRLEVYRSQGYKTELLGASLVPLRKLLEDLAAGQGTTQLPRWADIVRDGPVGGGEVLGRIRYSLRVLKRFPPEVMAEWAQSKGIRLSQTFTLAAAPFGLNGGVATPVATAPQTPAKPATPAPEPMFYTGSVSVHVQRVEETKGFNGQAPYKSRVYLSLNAPGCDTLNTKPRALNPDGHAEFNEVHTIQMINAPLRVAETAQPLSLVARLVEEDGAGKASVLGTAAFPLKSVVVDNVPIRGRFPLTDTQGAIRSLIYLDAVASTAPPRTSATGQTAPASPAPASTYQGTPAASAPPPTRDAPAQTHAAPEAPLQQPQEAPVPVAPAPQKLWKQTGEEPGALPGGQDDGRHIVLAVSRFVCSPAILDDATVDQVGFGYDFLRDIDEVYRSNVPLLPIKAKDTLLEYHEGHVYDCAMLNAWQSLATMLREGRVLTLVFYAVLDPSTGQTRLLGTHTVNLRDLLQGGKDLVEESVPVSAPDGKEIGRVQLTFRAVMALRRAASLL